MGGVHAIIGAAVGSFFKGKTSAFVAGVVSHLIADAAPHKDMNPAAEVAILAASMVAIAKWRGVDSPEFWGAVGAVIPDAEHALKLAGVITGDQEVFPTHMRDGAYHGWKTDEQWSQLLMGIASVITIAVNASSESPILHLLWQGWRYDRPMCFFCEGPTSGGALPA